MRIIPVIDVLNGKAVKAISGKREEYKLLKSVLTRSTDPIDVALAFESAGFKELYIADLDAIIRKAFNTKLFNLILAKTNLDIMIDVGIRNFEMVKMLGNSNTIRIIIGTETLESLELVKKSLDFFGEKRIIVSVDTKNGKVISKCDLIRFKEKYSVVKLFSNIGIETIIVLDLMKVGTENGINISEVESLLNIQSSKIIIGGGIRNIKNLNDLRRIGTYGALIASVLHNGKVTTQQLKSNEFL